ncbi:drebrin-like protein A isoform X1 [Anabas testudineus]|uniref:Drebrin-like a n=1 Tax=Anabas testudineus TaxID=64144 RepID=A0A3Q1I737_ANATE|nr:drebrin-like protein A isoform X1 [Anabas testudineus]XP_026212539.1 drebrin-like protein A isoform X1 [Anabas testudineus]
MAVNLSKNGAALMAAYKDVVDAKSDTNWALFTYEGNSNDIRLAEKGDGGLEEMVEELNSGKVMYAFCRVQDPNSGLPKYVLINWTGEGVKDSRKGICANHMSTIATFLKGAHVTINARAEVDVEPETILAKVAKASGANFNFHKQTEYRDAPRGPVGSVYRKVNAVQEIQQTNKDDFWVKAQRDEERRQQEEKKRAELERQKLEKERKEMEEKQAKERERKAKEQDQQIQQEKNSEKQREEEKERVREQQRLSSVYRKVNAVQEIQQTNKDDFWVKAQRDEERRQQEEKKRAELERQKLEKERKEMEEKQAKERERKAKERDQQIQQEKIYQKQREEEERVKEQQQLNQQDKENLKKGINSAASVQKANEAKVLISQRSINPRDIFKQREQNAEANAASSPTSSRPGKLQSPFMSQRSFETESAVQPQSPAAAASISWRSHLSPSPPDSPVPSHSPAAATSHSAVQPADAGHTEEDEWSDEFEDAHQATPGNLYQENLYDAPKPVQTDEQLYENVADEDNGAVANGENICAVALYDYQAVDDTEISFDPEDLITGIDMVDEGWWKGYGPDGHYGLFPANYVELFQP